MIGSFNNGDSNRSVRNKINSAISWIDEFGGAFSPTGIDTPAQLLLDETLTYAENTPRSVRETQILNIGGFRYQVAASTANDHHVATAGGVKLYVLPGADGADVQATAAALDGVTDDSTKLQLAIDTWSAVHSGGTMKTASIETTLDIPATARRVDFSRLTITQPDNANLSKLVSHGGYGNDYGETVVRLDGNKDNNTAVVGFQIDGTSAGERILFDVAGVNCDTLFKVTREVEHVKGIISGRNCGTVLELDTTTNDSDENLWQVFGYQSDTLFKTTGSSKSSGKVTVMGEVIEGWAVDLSNGWFSLDGIVRGTGRASGGGVRITSSAAGRIYFGGLQLYGQTPAPNVGTLGLLCDSSVTWLEGDLILGTFDGGVWIKTCQIGSKLRVNLTSAASYADGVRLGDFANTKLVNACEFDFNIQGAGTGFYGLNLDYVQSSIIRVTGDVVGGADDIVISANSFDNVIEVGRRAATSRTIVNNRTQLDNTVLYRGSYTQSDLTSVNGGSYFGGMQVEELIVGGGVRGPAYYDTTAAAWLPVSNAKQSVAATTIANVAGSINTAAKFAGKEIWDSTNNRAMRARGAAAADPWDVIDGSAFVTPS